LNLSTTATDLPPLPELLLPASPAPPHVPHPAEAAERRSLRRSWPARITALLSAYLPLLLMAVLALGTWWLVKNTPVPGEVTAQAAARHEPDYAMTNFTVQRFLPTGGMRLQVEGDALRHYPDTDTLEIDQARVRAWATNGRLTVATAKLASSNSDASEVQLTGGAHVTRQALAGEDVIEFKGEFLHAFFKTERMQSHLPVTVTRGRSVVNADGLEYDNLKGLLLLKGRVRATFAAPLK
jgi:lipopolysaccharide export system protein LptC